MSSKNDFDVHSKHLRVIGNEKDGYRVVWYGKVLKYTRSFEHAMDVAFALLFDDYERLIDWGIDPREVLSIEGR